MKECYKLLERYHRYLTRQQLLTLKGQIKSNDIDGFKKGLAIILKRRNEMYKNNDRYKNELQNKINKAVQYILEHTNKYELDEDKIIYEFDTLASPKVLLDILNDKDEI